MIISKSMLLFLDIMLDKETIESIELVTEEHRKSAVSAVGRGAVGAMVLGPIGLLAGLTAKDVGTHMVAVQFKDGKKSLIDLNPNYYKILTQIMF